MRGTPEEGKIEGIDLVELLKTINARIEKLLDKDHMIGHSYFLKIEDLEDLKWVFCNKIIPLLQEYFFGDYGKIGLVLGSGFVQIKKSTESDSFFAPFEDYEMGSLLEKKVYRIKNVCEMGDKLFLLALKTLLRKGKGEQS